MSTANISVINTLTLHGCDFSKHTVAHQFLDNVEGLPSSEEDYKPIIFYRRFGKIWWIWVQKTT